MGEGIAIDESMTSFSESGHRCMLNIRLTVQPTERCQ